MSIRRSGLLGLALACPMLLAPTAAYAAGGPAAPPAPSAREAPLPNPLPPRLPVQVSGSDTNRISMLFVGDGYTAAQLGAFRQDVANQWAAMTALEPYKTYQKFFNVYRFDIASPDSGISGDPSQGIVRNTVFNAHFFCHDIERLMCADNAKVDQLLKSVPNSNVVFVIGNSAKYGGAGGPVITVAGGNALAEQVTPHEAAHTLAGLCDEYGGYGSATDTGEPQCANASSETAQQMLATKTKWWRWIGATAPDGSVIGAFNGANYYDSGFYRPSNDSNMRTLGQPFNQPSAEALIESFYTIVRPIDSSSPAQGKSASRRSTVTISTPVLVGHDFRIWWAVNGKTIQQGYGSRMLDLSTVPNLAAGATVSVTVQDPTTAVRDEAFRSSKMTQTYQWKVTA